MFDNPVLEVLSRVHPVVPPALYLPVVAFCLVRAIGHEGLGIAPVAGVFALGLLAWSLAEYLLHRFVFHFQPDTRWGRRLHFIIHGVHHDYPHDPMRLVMPPSVSIPLAVATFFGFRALLGPAWSLPLFAGFVVGYLFYDMSHYHIHHHRSQNRLSLLLRRYHYRHHFQQSSRGFGVTSPFWDKVFGTFPVLRRRSG
jgi:sterol desaturase/sphingolipid hydroxylase (fatty acid hydroxylase superfamily)